MGKLIFFNANIYHLIAAFYIYSILGWFVESVYMSLCNRKITNRGFARGPFCPIYGFGAVGGYLMLSHFSHNFIELYIMGAFVATLFEFMVGKLMQKLFGEIWWDYNNKPFNYQGIICLESTIAWGFYAVIIVTFLHRAIMNFVERYDTTLGVRLLAVIAILFTVDFLYQLMRVVGWNGKGQREKIVAFYHNFKERWY